MSNSARAYEEIRSSGLLRELIFEIYEVFYKYGPMTAGEVSEIYSEMHPQTHRKRNEIAKRVSDLKAVGVLDGVQSRICNVTGKRCMVWRLNDRLPSKIQCSAKMSRKQLQAMVNDYREQALALATYLAERGLERTSIKIRQRFHLDGMDRSES